MVFEHTAREVIKGGGRREKGTSSPGLFRRRRARKVVERDERDFVFDGAGDQGERGHVRKSFTVGQILMSAQQLFEFSLFCTNRK